MSRDEKCISRYGGPGRLKKACIKRQCVVISQVRSNSPLVSDEHLSNSLSLFDPQIGSDSGSVSETKSGTVAVKSEPVFQHSLKPQPVTISSSGLTVPVSVGQTVSAPVPGPAPTILSWPPGAPYAPGQTFQVAVQQPVQFAFQPGTFQPGVGGVGQPQIQYATAGQIQQLTASQLGAV